MRAETRIAGPRGDVRRMAGLLLESGDLPSVGLTLAVLAAAIVLAVAGVAWSALLFAAAATLAGAIDRRVMVLAIVVVLPVLTAFDPLVATTVGRSTLDFRLLLTGSLAVPPAVWLAVDRPRIDRIAGLLIALVVVQAVLTPLSGDPLHALPTIARTVDAALAYLAARRWLTGQREASWLAVAAVGGALLPALSGILQPLVGFVRYQNDASRVAGIYATSPVGLALQMQLGALAAIGLPIVAIRARSSAALVAVALAAAFLFVLAETSTRLVFVSAMAGLLVIELVRRRWQGVVAVPIVAVVMLLVVSPALAGRLSSTGAGGVAATPSVPATATVAPGAPGVSAPAGVPPPVATTAPNVAAGGEDLDLPNRDASLQFRFYLWRTMLGEWAQSPIIGRGTGAFPAIFEHRSGIARVAPHNDYLGVLVENGIVGLAPFVAVQVLVLLALAHLRRRSGSPVVAELAMLGLVVFGATNVLNAVNNPRYYLDLQFTVFALAGATVALRPTDASSTAGTQP